MAKQIPEYSPTSKEGVRAEELFKENRQRIFSRADSMFAKLMIAQWLCAILVAIFWSPYGWEGKEKVFHFHLYVAILMGGGLTLFPVLLAKFKPGQPVTRHVVAISQMLWSALLIHLSGGRIETHFHVFGSLAFLSFYFDWKVLVTATLVVASEHFFRGLYYPESVYGITNPEWWRFLEHAFWVVFCDIMLVWSCISGTAEVREISEKQARIEGLSKADQLKSAALEMLVSEIQTQAKPA